MAVEQRVQDAREPLEPALRRPDAVPPEGRAHAHQRAIGAARGEAAAQALEAEAREAEDARALLRAVPEEDEVPLARLRDGHAGGAQAPSWVELDLARVHDLPALGVVADGRRVLRASAARGAVVAHVDGDRVP